MACPAGSRGRPFEGATLACHVLVRDNAGGLAILTSPKQTASSERRSWAPRGRQGALARFPI
eukprot:10313479-Alexandrium_andersonii.AAC.1